MLKTEIEIPSTREGSLLSDQVFNDLARLNNVISSTAAAARAPNEQKQVRPFSPGESADWVGVTVRHLNNIADDLGLELARAGKSNTRTYTLNQINLVRRELAKRAGGDTPKALRYDPRRREGEDLSILSVVNFKGGSAKSTTAVHTVQHLAMRGYRVLFIDLDGQGSASTVFGIQPELIEEDQSIFAALRYEDPLPLKNIIQKTYFENVDIAPGGMWMYEWETETPRVMTQAGFKEASARLRLDEIEEDQAASGLTVEELARLEEEKQNCISVIDDSVNTKQYFLRLRRALQEVEADYDVVVCDTSPSLNFVSQTTIGATKHLLVTIHPEWFDIKSMQQYLNSLFSHLRTLEEATDHVGEEARYVDRTMNYLVTRYEPADATESAISGMMRVQLDNVLENPMLKSAAISEAGLENQTIYESDKKKFTPSTFKRAMESMNAVNSEIEQIITRGWGRS